MLFNKFRDLEYNSVVVLEIESIRIILNLLKRYRDNPNRFRDSRAVIEEDISRLALILNEVRYSIL
jgi:hypothetical protein